jgi:GntR family transcriptional regulator/MocR family aminotransferase
MTTSAGALFVQLDSRARVPLQAQIATSIRHAILRGQLTPGTRLPSSRAMASELSVSRTTTVLAYEQLASEGYITTRSGSGTFVSLDLPDDGPRTPAASRRLQPRHPALSRRGRVLAGSPATIIKIDGPPRAFRIGSPALDLFPFHLWSRLSRRRERSTTTSDLDYGPGVGIAPLRDAIAAHVSRARGTTCAADQVIVVAGAQHGLQLISQLLLDPGDVAWIEEPAYPGARAALAGAGAAIQPVPVDADGLDPEGARTRRRPRLIYVTPSHQFPLGVTMSLPRRLSLLALARDSDAWIVEDDYDSEFRYGARPVPSLHGLDPDGRVIYVGSFSKTLFPALRIGYLIVPADLVEAIRASRRASDIHTPLLHQAIVADFIAEGHYERHLRRMRVEYGARLDALVAAARRHCGGALALRETTTGLHAVADLSGADAVRVSRAALAAGVEVMPLAAYSHDVRHATQALVLGFGSTRPARLDAGMEALAAVIDRARRHSTDIARTVIDRGRTR